jgi:hypothetical protein
MDLPGRAPAKLNPRVDFRIEEFRKLVFQRGMDLKWEQAQLCPCRRPAQTYVGTALGQAGALGVKGESTEPRVDCTVCEGSGYFWHSPQVVKGLITRANSTPEGYNSWGEQARAHVYITLLPEHMPSFLDRFTLVNSVLMFRESRVRTASAVEALRYPIVTRSLDLTAGPTDVNVLHIQKADANGVTTAAGALTQGADFAVTTDGKIDWTLGVAAGTAPVTDARYSVSYYASPRYLVTDHPHCFRDTFTQEKRVSPEFKPLPVQCSAALARMYEFGLGPSGIGSEGQFDVRRWLLTRVSKTARNKIEHGANGPYRNVPFRRTTAQIRQLGGRTAIEDAKALGRTKVVAGPDGKASWNGPSLARGYTSIVNNVNTNLPHRTDRLHGLRRLAARGGKSSRYLNFRRASWAGQPWMHRGVRARRIGDRVRREIPRIWELVA